MAEVSVLAPFILSWEGGFVCDKDDKGGATNKGVTISTWRSVGYDKDGDGDIDVDDLKLITDDDAVNHVLKPHYWDRWKADKINSQSIANILVDWVWASGKQAITIPQQMLGVKADGIVGNITLNALNSVDARAFFNRLLTRRKQFIENICTRNPSQKKFRSGWLRRLSYIGYGSLTYNTTKNAVHRFDDL